MELNSLIFWNAILSLIYAPLAYSIRANIAEIKRIDILLAKTREEIPRNYVTKADMRNDMDRLFKRFDKIEEKLDSMAQTK